MLTFMIAAALAAAAANAPQTGPAGNYRLEGGPDTASKIALAPDGRFAFWLMEGAVDLKATGRWSAEGRTLHLVTVPKPVPPAFTAGPAGRTVAAPLQVRVTGPDGRGLAGIDLRVGFDRGAPVEGYTQEDGWSLAAGEKRAPRWIELGLGMYGVGYTRFAVDAAKANALAFTLVPNDLGVLDFSAVEAEAADGALLLRLPGGPVGRYVRTGP